MNGKKTWIIGADPSCDLVLDRPSVSRRHCRLCRRPDGSYTVEDLGSTNGTFVNGRQVVTLTPVRRQDAVTLGLSVPFPWPDEPADSRATSPEGSRVLRVGREADNDVVIDDPQVSCHHARVLIAPGGREGIVEDLRSTNGTAVGAPGNVVTRAPITPGDVLYFGPVAVPAATFFPDRDAVTPGDVPVLLVRGAAMTVGRDPSCDRVIDFPMVSGRHARFFRAGGSLIVEDLGSSNGTFVNGRRIERASTVAPGDLIGLGSYTLRLADSTPDAAPSAEAVSAVPVPALAAVVPPATATTTRVVSPSLIAAGVGLLAQSYLLSALILVAAGSSRASALFGLSLAAVWIGLTAALGIGFLGLIVPGVRPGSRTVAEGVAKSFAFAAAIDLVLCAVVLGIVAFRVPLGAQWPAAWGVLWLTALVGSALGQAVLRLSGQLPVGIAAAAGLIVVMALLGGPSRPLPALGPVGRLAAEALPTRWSFEALLSLSDGGQVGDPAADPVERFFPAESDRSGIAACATALIALIGGLVYADALIALNRAGPPRPAGPESR
jgi:pSer/pThr/pTyr-binding forkhead associated (FHA) protein